MVPLLSGYPDLPRIVVYSSYGVKTFTLKIPTPNIKECTSKEITAYTRAQEVTDTQSRKVTRRDLSDS